MIMAKMLGMEPAEIGDDAEIRDAMGEVANMIAGSVKNALVRQGTAMEIAVPTVAVGRAIGVEEDLSGDLFGHRLHFLLGDGHRITVTIRFQKDKGNRGG